MVAIAKRMKAAREGIDRDNTFIRSRKRSSW